MFDFAIMPSLGIDIRSIVFQLINFGILLWILQRFAFRPLIQVLQDRKEAIEESLRTADELDLAKAEMEKTRQSLIAQARQESDVIVQQAKQVAEDIVSKAHDKAAQQTDAMKKRAEQEIEQQVVQAQSAMKSEVANLVVMATEKIIKKKLDPVQDEALITQALYEKVL